MGNSFLMFLSWVKVFMLEDTIKCFVSWLKLCLEVEFRKGSKNQVSILVTWSQHWVPASPKSWWILRASSGLGGCWALLSLVAEKDGLPWIPDIILIHYQFFTKISVTACYPFAVMKLWTIGHRYVNWIFITILGNIEIPFPPTFLPVLQS